MSAPSLFLLLSIIASDFPLQVSSHSLGMLLLLDGTLGITFLVHEAKDLGSSLSNTLFVWNLKQVSLVLELHCVELEIML